MQSAKEDYLKHIYTLQTSGVKVRTKNLADIMAISMPSVSEMIKKLTLAGYILNKPYHGFRLTHKGELIALSLIRKHRLLEYFMINMLKFEWEEVHNEAERLEHAVSDKFINKLDSVLGFPETDPHGHPIPDLKGKFKVQKSIPLSAAQAGKSYKVSSVNDRSEEILKYLKDIGIRINTGIKIDKVLSFDGSVLLLYKKKKLLLSRRIADSIYVI